MGSYLAHYVYSNGAIATLVVKGTDWHDAVAGAQNMLINAVLFKIEVLSGERLDYVEN